MANPFDAPENAAADNALIGGLKADNAFGIGAPRQQTADLKQPHPAMQRSRDQLAGAYKSLDSVLAPTPQAPDPIVGYDPASGQVFSGGKTFNLHDNLEAITATKQGALDINNDAASMPANFRPLRASQVKGFVERIPDWQKELQAGTKSYTANLALLGGTVANNQHLKDEYLRMRGEADILSGASAAPKSWDEAEFGKNMLPYIRQLGLGSAPYVAEALITGFGAGTLLKGAGTAAARATLEGTIRNTAQQAIARSTMGGVATMSEAQAMEFAARQVGQQLARGAGVAAGTYPSAVGDILSNQMEQSGQTNLGAAAALGVPYAGLNLLGLEGMAGGIGRATDRALGATSLSSRTARAAAAGGSTLAGEALNETGQEVLNQAGRMAVDPNATLTDPAALARYKEAAIGGAILGGAGGALRAGSAAMRPAEPAVTPQLIDQNNNALAQRWEVQAGQEALAAERAAAPGGEQFQGPAPGQPTAPAAEVDPSVEFLKATLGRKKLSANVTKVLDEVKAAGFDIQDDAMVDVVNALTDNKPGAARKALKEAANARVPSAPAGAVPGDGGPAGPVDGGGQPPAVGGGNDGLGAGAGRTRRAVGRGRSSDAVGVPDGVVDEALTSYAPSEGPLATESFDAQPAEAAPLQTNNTRPDGVQGQLFAPARNLGAGRAWNQNRGNLPRYEDLDRELKEQVDAMHEAGQLNRAGVRRMAEEAARVRRVERQGAQRQSKDVGAVDVEELAGVFARAFGIKEGNLLHGSLVRGMTYGDLATETKTGEDAVRKSLQLAPGRARAKWSKAIADAVTSGRISAAEGERVGEIVLRGSNTKARRDQAAEIQSGTQVVDKTEGKEQDQDTAAQAERRSESNTDDDSGSGVVYQDDRGTVTAEDLAKNGMSVETGVSTADQDAKTRMSEKQLTAMRKSDPQEYASVVTSRALEKLEEVQKLKGQLAKADPSKKPAIQAKIEKLTAGAQQDFILAEEALQDGRARGQVAADEDVDTDAESELDIDEDLSFGSAGWDVVEAGDRQTYTRQELVDEVRDLMGGRELPDNIAIVESPAQLGGRNRAIAEAFTGAVGWAEDGKVVIIANRVPLGKGRGIFLHEVGNHLGLDKLLGEEVIRDLALRIDRMANSGGPDGAIAKRALARVENAKTPTNDVFSETVAYFVSEALDAGVKPTAETRAGALLRRIYDVFKKALVKLWSGDVDLTMQDIVDMSYGAAHKVYDMAGETDGTSSGPRFAMNSVAGKLPLPLRQQGSNIGEVIKGAGQASLNALTFTEDIIARAVKAGLTAADTFREAQQRRAARAGELERQASKVLEPFKSLSDKQQKLANTFIYESTRSGKWGFKPTWGKDVTVDADTAYNFSRLDASTQDFVKQVFKHGYDTLQRKQKLVRDNVGAELDQDIAKAKAAGNDKLAEDLESTKKSLLSRFETLFRISDGTPYAPLRRQGNWLVVAKSQKYLDAEATGDNKTMHALESDPDEYHVSFAPTRGAAAKMAQDLQTDGFPKSGVVFRPKDAAAEQLYGGNGLMGAFLKIKAQVETLTDNATGPEKARLESFNRIVTNMYLNALGEASARRSELRRKGVAGNIDMISGFSEQAQADANFMASVEYNHRIIKAIKGMKKQAQRGDNQADKMAMYNELALRHAGSLQPQENRLADRMTRVTSLWMLATSPAYMLTNMTQTFVLSLPFMSKRHGYAAAANQIVKSYGVVVKLLEGTGVRGQVDFDKAPADVRQAIKELVELGRIDIGLESEMGSFKIEGDNRASKAWNAVDNGLRLIIMKIESINRLSAAMAAYRLERAKGGTHEQAVEYAGRVITQTHGDYSRLNAPRIFNTGLGRVALQFRKFQLIQLTYLAKLLRDSFSNSDERWLARKALGFTMAHMAVLGGMVGMPGYAVLGGIAAALSGGEGPDDAEEMLRKKIGNQALADLITRGAPAALGLDFSGKVGMGNLLSVLPFTDVNFTDRKSVSEIGFALMAGATGGLALRGSDALRHMANGDYYRGVESSMPSGIMNLMKAARFATDGVTNTKGDTLVPGSNVGIGSTIVQALGFTPTDTARRNLAQNIAYDVNDYFRQRQAELKRDYVRAVRNGGTPATVVKQWQDMQASMRERGMQVAPIGNLYKAPADQAKRERNTAGGVQFTKQTQGLVRDMAGQ